MRWILILIFFASSVSGWAEDTLSPSQWADKMFESTSHLITGAGSPMPVVLFKGRLAGATNQCGLFLSRAKGDPTGTFYVSVGLSDRADNENMIGGFAGDKIPEATATQTMGKDLIRLLIHSQETDHGHMVNSILVKLDKYKMPIQATASSTFYPSLDCVGLH